MDEIKSPIKAIRAFCLDCCGGSPAEVRECSAKSCQLKPFRFGKNPYIKREMTEEQRERAKANLEKARDTHG